MLALTRCGLLPSPRLRYGQPQRETEPFPTEAAHDFILPYEGWGIGAPPLSFWRTNFYRGMFMANSNDLFLAIQTDLKSISSKITQLRRLELTERERLTVDHIENALAAFDVVTYWGSSPIYFGRDPQSRYSSFQDELDRNIRERQRISYS